MSYYCHSTSLLRIKVIWSKLQIIDHVWTSESAYLQLKRKVHHRGRKRFRHWWEAYLRAYNVGKYCACIIRICLGPLHLHRKWHLSSNEFQVAKFKDRTVRQWDQLPFKSSFHFHVHSCFCHCIYEWILFSMVFDVL